MNTTKVISIVLLVVGVLLFLLGALIKILHWPGVNYFLISGAVLFFIGVALLFKKGD
ncbi:hypothetical protein ABW636_02390 [Aquimarina sp. 2201CG1-2-11]|uniref:hypothetical protein n=1 Tax=Aquimarina discodermiae TaxID=3231043 RepID=UPI0034622439